MSDNISLFAKNLKKERERLNITQKALAEQANATPTTISAYEKGTKNPSLDMAVNLAKALWISLDTLCGLNNRAQMNNYGDLLHALITIDEKTNISLEYDELRNACLLRFEDDKINTFLNSWRKIKDKFDNDRISDAETDTDIDTDVYIAWLEKQIREYTAHTFE